MVSDAGLPPGEEQRRMRLRLSILEACVLAAERREEVIEAVPETADPKEARRSVAQLLGITEDDASGVLDLRVRHFSQGRDRTAQERSRSPQGPPGARTLTWAVFRNDPLSRAAAVRNPSASDAAPRRRAPRLPSSARVLL